MVLLLKNFIHKQLTKWMQCSIRMTHQCISSSQKSLESQKCTTTEYQSLDLILLSNLSMTLASSKNHMMMLSTTIMLLMKNKNNKGLIIYTNTSYMAPSPIKSDPMHALRFSGLQQWAIAIQCCVRGFCVAVDLQQFSMCPAAPPKAHLSLSRPIANGESYAFLFAFPKTGILFLK